MIPVRNRKLRGCRRHFQAAFAAVLAMCLAACAPSGRHASPLEAHARSPDAAAPAASASRFQYIYLIHGDAGYAYHDTSGRRHLADTEAVSQARYVALHAPEAEVFIFHQVARRNRWFHAPYDGLMYHYRNGSEVEKIAYRRDPLHGDFQAEADLLRGLAAPSLAGADPTKVFLYFGHEIPPREMKGYSRSLPDQDFSLAEFTRGLQRFAGPAGLAGSSGLPDPAHARDSAQAGGPSHSGAKPFSLIVISACNGGTPAVTQALAPFTPLLLASPGELHLSFLDTRPLAASLPASPGNRDVSRYAQARAWGEGIAGTSFDRLKATTETAVTLSLYDMDQASAYLQAHEQAWIPVGGEDGAVAGTVPVFRDCADKADFGPGGAEAGVTTYYRPPQFGWDKRKTTYSGWGCPAFPAPAFLQGVHTVPALSQGMKTQDPGR